MTTLSAAQVADELRRAEAAIDAYAIQSPRPLFRPPFGTWGSEVLAGAGAAGYRWTFRSVPLRRYLGDRDQRHGHRAFNVALGVRRLVRRWRAGDNRPLDRRDNWQAIR